MLNYIHGPVLADYMVNENADIKSCLQVLQNTNAKFLIVVDSDQRFRAIAVEGDIRRGFLKNIDLSDPIKHVMNTTPHVANKITNYNQISSSMSRLGIDVYPVVIDGRCCGVFANLPRIISSRTAVLMLGGLGSRLKPLTDTTPKPLLNLGQGTILDHIIDKLIKYGFRKIIMCLNYLSEQFREKYFQDERPIEFIFINEPKKLGTGGALSLVRKYIGENEDILIMNGDLISDIDLNEMFITHQSQKADATMGVYDYSILVPFGVINAEDSRFISCEEKPIIQKLVNMGIYVVNTSCLKHMNRNQYIEMPDFLEALLSKNRDIRVYLHDSEWFDVGTLSQFKEAQNLNLENFL